MNNENPLSYFSNDHYDIHNSETQNIHSFIKPATALYAAASSSGENDVVKGIKETNEKKKFIASMDIPEAVKEKLAKYNVIYAVLRQEVPAFRFNLGLNIMRSITNWHLTILALTDIGMHSFTSNGATSRSGPLGIIALKIPVSEKIYPWSNFMKPSQVIEQIVPMKSDQTYVVYLVDIARPGEQTQGAQEIEEKLSKGQSIDEKTNPYEIFASYLKKNEVEEFMRIKESVLEMKTKLSMTTTTQQSTSSYMHKAPVHPKKLTWQKTNALF